MATQCTHSKSTPTKKYKISRLWLRSRSGCLLTASSSFSIVNPSKIKTASIRREWAKTI